MRRTVFKIEGRAKEKSISKQTLGLLENLQESRRAGPGGSFTARNRAGLRDTLSPAQKCIEP